MNTAIDLTAKLLATENLTVVKAAVKTASFNVKSRQLTLPIFKHMTPEIESMLVGHEVGHALYTTMDMMEASKEDYKIHDYINVVEDVRVEKLMKRKYPGLKKTMIEGYRQLNERDFFGVKEIKNIRTLNLIDRMNLWFKVGISSGVSFSEQEKVFVTRAEKTETSIEVVELAKDIYEFCKNELENSESKDSSVNNEHTEESEESEGDNSNSDDQQQQPEDNVASDQGSKTPEEIEEDNSNSDASDQGSKTPEEIEEELESKTNKSLMENLDNSVDMNAEYNYLRLDTDYDPDTIVGYKTILSETETEQEFILNRWGYKEDIPRRSDAEYIKFKSNTLKTVNYLIKEFEMKKAATQYKRNQVSKSGSLDMKKIWGYQLNDDLFKRITTTQDGKKHGMIFLIDWSGSMNEVIGDVIQQVTTLSMFCHRLQIPFQVLAFSDYYYNCYDNKPYSNRRKDRFQQTRLATNLLNNATKDCALLEFFSHKMSNKDFNDMAKRLFNTYKFTRKSEYSLGGTPLNEALAYMTDHIGKFMNTNNVEKMSFITLTDGAGSTLRAYNAPHYGKNFLVDPITKINYDFQYNATEQTNTLLKMIKDRYNVANIGFYVAGSLGRSEINSASYNNGIYDIDIDEVRKEVRLNGFASFKTKGRDDLFLVPAKSLRIKDIELEVSSKQSTSSIANKFTKMMEGRQVNRLLLNKFIGYVA
jgi:hypothetical protein